MPGSEEDYSQNSQPKQTNSPPLPIDEEKNEKSQKEETKLSDQKFVDAGRGNNKNNERSEVK